MNNFLVCSDTVPSIQNGNIDTGATSDASPYFINEVIVYSCNPGFSSEGADLTNTCQQNNGPDDLMWSRTSIDLNGICRAGELLEMLLV